MGIFGSKPRYVRVVRVEAPDERSFDSTVAHLERHAPDILGYTGTRVRAVKTGASEGVLIIEGRDEAQMETHVSMTSELADTLEKKFGVTMSAFQGPIVWTS